MESQQQAGTEEENQHADYADHIPEELGRTIEEFMGAEGEKQEGADEGVGQTDQLLKEKPNKPNKKNLQNRKKEHKPTQKTTMP